MTNLENVRGMHPTPKIVPLPPVVFLAFAVLGWLLERLVPLGVTPVPRESVIAGVAICVIALAIGGLAVAEMRRAQTPVRPGLEVKRMVTTGIFTRTRNPMYLGMALLLIGAGIASANPWLILMGPLLLVYFTFRVVNREEAYLEALFGDEYRAYRKRVRRWI